ncbi:MAG: vitamin K epoxide reductase family protein [Candidatus Magasanikbacteria bacterium]|jgi:uncharacterized membrane protein|nr:vitamin K epoxide reductase family protein [Candidatus Magasanikbacteria bacterium]
MPILKQESKPLLSKTKWIAIAILCVSLIGFSDASYLTFAHYSGEGPACSVLEGCDEVTTSEYSTVLGIPVALGGAFFYLTMLLLSIMTLESKQHLPLKLAGYLSPAGFLASVWFVYLQLYVIEAICLYCMGSAITSTLLFILGMYALKKIQEKHRL